MILLTYNFSNFLAKVEIESNDNNCLIIII